MKRRGKMRPDTNTAPEMGEGKVWRPLFSVSIPGFPGEGVTTGPQHIIIICRASELPT